MLRRILTLGIVALALGLVAPAIGVQAGIGAGVALAQDPAPAPDPEDPPDAPDEPEAPDAPDEPEAPDTPDAPDAPEDDEGSGDAGETDDDGDDEEVAPAPPAPAAPAPASAPAAPAPVETGPAPVQERGGTDVEGKQESHKPSGSVTGETRHLTTTTPQRVVFQNTSNRTSGTDTGTFPQGGIQAGAGGMAEDGPASLLLLSLAALALGLMSGGVVLRRRSLGS
jgi:hypothetical protein